MKKKVVVSVKKRSYIAVTPLVLFPILYANWFQVDLKNQNIQEYGRLWFLSAKNLLKINMPVNA